MYIQKLSIEVKTRINKNDIINEFGLLMNYYRANGQKQGSIESQYINKNTITALPFALELDSLDSKYNNIYVNDQILKIEKLCNSKMEFSLIGEEYENQNMTCKCHKSDFYILMTNHAVITSPLTCGNCYGSVPLYRLPKYSDSDYSEILSWETDYICCDKLQMNCGAGERWGMNQMQKVDSQLSKEGIEICKKIEELTIVPTYYFLYNYRKTRGNQSSRSCPICNNRWDLKEQLHNFFDFKCDVCRLMSTISANA